MLFTLIKQLSWLNSFILFFFAAMPKRYEIREKGHEKRHARYWLLVPVRF